jgi:hypothetical protein
LYNEIKTCEFCHQDETIKHLFFKCKFARSIWSIIQVTSSLPCPPPSVANTFYNWLHGIFKKYKFLTRAYRNMVASAVVVVVIGSVPSMDFAAMSQAACGSCTICCIAGPTYLVSKPRIISAGSMYGFPASSKASDVSSYGRLVSPIT